MGRNKGKKPAGGKQSIEKDKDSETVNEELVLTPAGHSKDIENVDQDKGVSGGVDVDRYHSDFFYWSIVRSGRHAGGASGRFPLDLKMRIGAYESWKHPL